MSQSSKTNHSFGSVSLSKVGNFSSGSTSSVDVNSCPAHVSLADSNATLTAAQIRSGCLSMTPTANRTLTTPSAAVMCGSNGLFKKVGQCVDFSVINLGADEMSVILAGGSSVSTLGFLTVRDSSATTAADSGSAMFRIRATNVSSGSEACVLYRLS